MATIIDVSRLPAPNVVEPLDFEAIYQAQLADFRARLPEWNAVLESDPVLKLLEATAYRELLLRQRVNEAAKGVMLAYAAGPDLDQIGALFGVSRLDGEDDTRLRYRVQQGFAALGAAGPVQAYRAHAMAVSIDVIDVSIESTLPGRVDVCVLGRQMIEEAQATEEEIAIGAIVFPGEAGALMPIVSRHNSPLLLAVIAALNAEEVRPLTDHVVVVAPTVKQAPVTAQITVYPGTNADSVLAVSRAGLDAYLARIKFPGYDMTLAGLIGALDVPGVQNVAITSPAADIVCAFNEMAIASSVAVTVAGYAK